MPRKVWHYPPKTMAITRGLWRSAPRVMASRPENYGESPLNAALAVVLGDVNDFKGVVFLKLTTTSRLTSACRWLLLFLKETNSNSKTETRYSALANVGIARPRDAKRIHVFLTWQSGTAIHLRLWSRQKRPLLTTRKFPRCIIFLALQHMTR